LLIVKKKPKLWNLELGIRAVMECSDPEQGVQISKPKSAIGHKNQQQKKEEKGSCLYQGAPKKKKKKATYLPTYLFLRFFEIFRSDFRNYFYGVVGLLILMQRNDQKRGKKNRWEKTKDDRKKVFFLNFFGQKFLTWTSFKKFFMAVFYPLLRNAQKRHKKDLKKK
jgi:hypothetical protein